MYKLLAYRTVNSGLLFFVFGFTMVNKEKRNITVRENTDRNHQIALMDEEMQNHVCLTLKEYLLYFYSNAERIRKEANEENKTQARPIKTFM